MRLNALAGMSRVMSHRRATTLLETLLVFAIIAVMIGLLLPAVQAARRQAIETLCKNNVKQINLAVADYFEIHKKLPGPGRPGFVGGWTIDVLPFLDQKNLRDRATPGVPIAAAPTVFLRQPRIMTCPIRAAAEPPGAATMDVAHYILAPLNGRKSYNVCDAPLAVSLPWASGPELAYPDVIRQIGPHRRGFFVSGGFHDGVSFQPTAQDGR